MEFPLISIPSKAYFHINVILYFYTAQRTWSQTWFCQTHIFMDAIQLTMSCPIVGTALSYGTTSSADQPGQDCSVALFANWSQTDSTIERRHTRWYRCAVRSYAALKHLECTLCHVTVASAFCWVLGNKVSILQIGMTFYKSAAVYMPEREQRQWRLI